ncbi:unnamed protein product, partial [Allacma fusca]
MCHIDINKAVDHGKFTTVRVGSPHAQLCLFHILCTI